METKFLTTCSGAFITQTKGLWVQKRTKSMKQFLCQHPKGLLKLMDKIYSQFYTLQRNRNNIFALYPSQQFFSYVGTDLPGLNQYLKQGLMCLAHGHNAVMPVRLEPATPPSCESRNLPLSHCAPRNNIIS